MERPGWRGTKSFNLAEHQPTARTNFPVMWMSHLEVTFPLFYPSVMPHEADISLPHQALLKLYSPELIHDCWFKPVDFHKTIIASHGAICMNTIPLRVRFLSLYLAKPIRSTLFLKFFQNIQSSPSFSVFSVQFCPCAYNHLLKLASFLCLPKLYILGTRDIKM